ncbi:MAG TPA: hypothetical protein VKY26_00350 [Actinomycetota bacterium]|nr:hypothetical protein [Actinomycetota bacterium]
MGSILLLRWVLLALALVLGIVLLATGDTLIGGIILAMAVVRGVMIVAWTQRRSQLRQRYRGRFGGPGNI